MPKITIATHNEGKAKEFAALFKPFGYEIETLSAYPELGEIEETGQSFFENALLKAQTVAKQLACFTVADDSGLEVEALNGAPGIYSARYAGLDHDDEKNREKLLLELAGVPAEKRQARFRCCLVVVNPAGELMGQYEGTLAGRITEEERGDLGFGYDSLFLVPEKAKTLAELSMAEKNALSHRGKALELLEADLQKGRLF